MAFDIFPQFHFDQYTMRPLKIDDALAYYEYMTHDAVSQFINRSNRVHSINKAEEEINYWRKLFYNRQGIYWGIALNDTLIGTAGYNMLLLQDRKGEISYDLKYEYWGARHYE